jgi:hypothetical protein
MEQFKIPGTIVLTIGPAEEQLMSCSRPARNRRSISTKK